MKKFSLLILLCWAFSCSQENSSDGDVLFENGKYEQAVDAYSNYLAIHPDHAKTLYNRGRAYEELGNVQKATSDFQRILAIDPNYVNAFLSLAKLEYNQNKYAQVLHYAGKALALNENSAQAHFLSARASHQLGYADQALESYNNAISINKDFGDAFLYRGALKVGVDKQRSACEDFKFAQSLGVEAAASAIAQYCK